MKLLNHTLLYFSVALLGILGVWATLFYFEILDEVYDSLDDGLDNYKTLIIKRVEQDSSILHKASFAESNYAIREIPAAEALKVTDVHKDTTLFMENEQDYEPVRLLTTAFGTGNGRYYELKIITSMVEEDDLIEDLLYSLLWLYLAMLLSILVLNNLLLRRVWRPFYALLGQLKTYKLGQEEPFAPEPTNVQEFKDLNEAVISMLQRNQDTYRSQKQFIENASHELQTPLAISLNKLELLAEQQELSEESLAAVGKVMETLERLTRLNRSLLMLSKIENRQYEHEEAVDFNALAAKLLEQLADLAEFREVTISLKEDGHFTKTMNPDLAEILLSNLIKNAIVHNTQEGRVEVTITPVSISLGNTGKSGPLDVAKVFDRFYKNGEERTSTGLGLAIVKAVAERYGLQVLYSFKDGKHVFVVA